MTTGMWIKCNFQQSNYTNKIIYTCNPLKFGFNVSNLENNVKVY